MNAINRLSASAELWPSYVAYWDLLNRIIAQAPLVGYDSVQSLPEFTDADLRIVLDQRPELFHEAIADSRTIGRVTTHFLGVQQPQTDRDGLIGAAVKNALWSYIKPLLLADVQEEIERQQRQAEDPSFDPSMPF